MEGELVITERDHLCGKCREVISAKSSAWEVPVKTLDGKEKRIIVRVRYHPECFGVTGGLGSDS
jgi:hypothetical protein